MRRILHRHLSVVLALVAVALVLLGVTMAGCAPALPEADSEPARLYVQFCSGEGCHGAIPPRTGGPGYWRNQYVRMIELMREQGWPLPDTEEDRMIRDYLQRHAG